MNKKVLGVILASIILLASGFGTYYYFISEDKATSFTKIEREWIQNNKLNLIDIGVENDIPVLNYVGEGLVFDFFKDFEKTTELTLNRISYSYNDEISTEYKFKTSKNLESNQIKIYEDDYILLMNENKKYTNINEIKNLKLGVLKADLSEIKTYLEGLNNELVGYDTIETLASAAGFKEYDASLDGILVPKLLSLKYALSEKAHIAYLVDDLKINYVIELGSNDKLNTIIRKYYKKWQAKEFKDEFDKYFTNSYFEFSRTDQNEVASFKGKRYTYGYIDNPFYDITISGDAYGANKAILDNFALVADIEIVYKNYSDINSLLNAFNDGAIDLFFNSTDKTGYDLNGYVSFSAFPREYVVISKNKSLENIYSFKSLKGKEVAALKGSSISRILKNVGAEVTGYKKVEDLVKSNDDLIVLDYVTYDYYKKSELGNYKIEYTEKISDGYGYTMKSVSANKIFNEYFDFYLKAMPQNKEIGSGANEILTKNNNKGLLKKFLIISGAALVYMATIIFVTHSYKTKQPSISFKKSEKIKYMDMLTSLKNRNYLNDNIDRWEESQVYPQTIIIVDLNNIAYINDNYGHNAGDEEIKEAANVLIKNQVINSDIVRTNGNEFLIYLVGYKEHQIELYIKKLNKELKELKHGFGAAIGYSMITDDIKTIDDAINEATIEMRKIKEEANDYKDEV